MTVTRRILTVTTILSTVIVLFSFIGFYLGYDGLLVIGTLELPSWVYGVSKLFVYFIQYTLITCFIVDEYTYHVLYTSVVITITNIISAIVIVYFNVNPFAKLLFSSIVPFVIIFIAATKHSNFKSAGKRTLITISIIGAYQVLALITKTGAFILGYNPLTQYQWLVCSIDLVIVIILIFTTGGEKHVLGQILGRNTWKCNIFPEEVNVVKNDDEDRATQLEFDALTGFRRIRAVSLFIGFQIIQWTIILFMCALGNVLIEGTVITVSFVVHGSIIKRRWHSKSIVICTLVSALMFYVAARAIPAFGYTQLFPVIVGIILLYTMYRIAVYVDKNETTKEELLVYLQSTKPKPFCCDTATEEEMRTRCRSLGKSKEYEQFCVLAFTYKERRKDIAAQLFLAESTVKEYKRVRRKELEME